MFIAAQVISAIAIIVLAIGMLKKKKKTTLIFNGIANVLDIVIYLLLGRYVASLMIIGVLTRTITFTFMVEEKFKNIKKWLCAVFILYFVVMTIILWQDAKDIFTLTNFSMMTIAFAIANDKQLKYFYIASCLMMICYNLMIGGYVNAIKVFIQLIFTIIGLILIIKAEKNSNKVTADIKQVDKVQAEESIEENNKQVTE